MRAFVRPSIMNFVSPAQNEAISRVILRDIPLYYQYQQQYAYQFSESAVGAGHRHHQRSADQIQSRVQKYSKLRTVTLSSRAGDPPGHVYNNINTERNLACPDASECAGPVGEETQAQRARDNNLATFHAPRMVMTAEPLRLDQVKIIYKYTY